MNEFLKMDIFFFITTIVVVVAGVLVCICLYYLVRILRNAEKVSEEIEHNAHAITKVRNTITSFFRSSKKHSK
jgi:cell division protein ZapA (FtsZ GTPase activity inhibitor)